MPPLTPLLEVQEFDLASDQLILRRRTLPEREALVRCHARTATLEEHYATLIEQRGVLKGSEHSLSGEVAGVAAKAKEVEDKLYSGTIKVPKELEGLQEEIRLLRVKQSGLEEQEMELLEEIEQIEAEMAENRDARDRSNVEAGDLGGVIEKAENEIDAELATLARHRADETRNLPPTILAEYDRLRTKPRMAGRAAARLDEGSCGGCRVRLPVLEYNRMKAKPEDALLCCVHCGRVLVR